MKNACAWAPSKYVQTKGRLRASPNPAALAPSSVLAANLIAEKYDGALTEFAHGILLDLGCGHVPLYAAYREVVDATVCVDWPSTLHQSPHIDVFADLSKQLPFAINSFDTVLSSDVMEHLPHPDLAFDEIRRVLKPGGVLLLNTPFMYRVHEAPNDYYRYTRYALERLATQCGLDVVRIEEIGGAIDVLADTLSKILVVIPLVGRPTVAALQNLVLLLGGTRVFRHLRRASATTPMGYFMVARKPVSSA